MTLNRKRDYESGVDVSSVFDGRGAGPSDTEIKERDGNQCARDGSIHDLHVHHRVPRSGGRDERASNRITLCAFCHRWVHHNPQAATGEGWVVLRTSDPALIPVNHVLWPAGPVLLTDEHAGIEIWQG